MTVFSSNTRFIKNYLSLCGLSFATISIVSLFAFTCIFSTAAEAGLYHVTKVNYGGPVATQQDTLACAQCHTMHGTQGGQSLMYYAAESGNLYPNLLRASSIMKLCKWCHDGNSGPVGGLTPPDVFNSTVSNTYLPSAGDFMHNNYASNRNRHDIERTGMDTVPPPGYIDPTGSTWSSLSSRYGGATKTFTCLYCHDQHGNKNYRNLRYDPGNPTNDTYAAAREISYRVDGTGAWTANNCSDGSGATYYCDVNITATATNTDKYKRGNVTFKISSSATTSITTGTATNRISTWCGKCHTKFYDVSGIYGNETAGPYLGGGTAAAGTGPGDNNNATGTSAWRRHPVGDVRLTTANGHVDATTWTMSTTKLRYADENATNDDDTEQPFCLSCHYAHGGGNPNKLTDPTLDHSMLVVTDATGDINLDLSAAYVASEGTMRNTCQQCHNQ